MIASLTSCPHCGAPAEVTRRFVLESTDGPIEHTIVMCVDRHWFTLPLAALADTATASQVPLVTQGRRVSAAHAMRCPIRDIPASMPERPRRSGRVASSASERIAAVEREGAA